MWNLILRLPGVVGLGEMGEVGVGGATDESNELSVRSSDLSSVSLLPKPRLTMSVLGFVGLFVVVPAAGTLTLMPAAIES